MALSGVPVVLCDVIQVQFIRVQQCIRVAESATLYQSAKLHQSAVLESNASERYIAQDAASETIVKYQLLHHSVIPSY